MMFFKDIFPVILYALLIILVIVLIILVIRLSRTISKVDKVVEEVHKKVGKLDNLITIVDYTADTLSLLNDKFVSFLTKGILGLFRKNKKKKVEDRTYE